MKKMKRKEKSERKKRKVKLQGHVAAGGGASDDGVDLGGVETDSASVESRFHIDRNRGTREGKSRRGHREKTRGLGVRRKTRKRS